jgi:hypothetical protein
VNPRASLRLEGFGDCKKSDDLVENRIRHLPVYSIVLQTTALPHAPRNSSFCLQFHRIFQNLKTGEVIKGERGIWCNCNWIRKNDIN